MLTITAFIDAFTVTVIATGIDRNTMFALCFTFAVQCGRTYTQYTAAVSVNGSLFGVLALNTCSVDPQDPARLWGVGRAAQLLDGPGLLQVVAICFELSDL